MEPSQETPNLEEDALATQQGSELNPEAAAWFKEYPNVDDAVALPREKKQEFIKKYYAQDDQLDEQIEKMYEEAESAVQKEIDEGKNVAPFSEILVLGLINISKVKVLDDLIDEVDKLYKERRTLVKGKSITDKGVAIVTQKNCQKMAGMVQQKVVRQLEEEVKSRNIDLNQFMQIALYYLIGDLGIFVEIEKFYNLKKVEQNKDTPCDLEKLKIYIQESIKISDLIISDQINHGSLFLFPHILSDKLFNETGYESEEIVYYIRKMNEEGTIPDDTLDLIVQEAYAVEKSKDKCFASFDNQMREAEEAERQFIAMQRAHPQTEDILEQDKALAKMMKMGLNVPGVNTPQMGFPMGMIPPGFAPPGYFPVGLQNTPNPTKPDSTQAEEQGN